MNKLIDMVLFAVFAGVTQNDIEAKRHKKEVDMVRDLQQYLDSYARTNRPGSFRHRNSLSRSDNNTALWENFMASSRMPNAVVMHIAAANGYLEAMDLLLKNKYPVDLEDEDGWLPIHAAVAWNQVIIHPSVNRLDLQPTKLPLKICMMRVAKKAFISNESIWNISGSVSRICIHEHNGDRAFQCMRVPADRCGFFSLD